MASHSKQTSGAVASLAAKTLKSPNACAAQKSLAGSALAQHGTGKETGKVMEAKAAGALASSRTSAVTKTLAASVTSQSTKRR